MISKQGVSGFTSFPYLVNGLHDPVDTCIAADSLVLRINQDNFEVLVGGVLVDPVGVQHSQVCAATANTLLSR